MVIDPLEPLVYLDGQMIVRSGLPVDMVADMANVELPDVPFLGDLTLPLRTPVGVSVLLSPRSEANFLEVRGGLEVDGGIAQRVLKFEGKPLDVNGVARLRRHYNRKKDRGQTSHPRLQIQRQCTTHGPDYSAFVSLTFFAAIACQMLALAELVEAACPSTSSGHGSSWREMRLMAPICSARGKAYDKLWLGVQP